MIVMTSIFVAEVNSKESLDDRVPISERVNNREECERELISLYEGKNRVEPLE